MDVLQIVSNQDCRGIKSASHASVHCKVGLRRPRTFVTEIRFHVRFWGVMVESVER